jgi:cbb3-type cytochrome oxidase subunit 3
MISYRPKGTCVLGANYSAPVYESCRALEVDETIGGGIAAGVIVIVIVLAVIAFVFWKRKRDVETKYERLRGEVPLDDMDETVDLDADT